MDKLGAVFLFLFWFLFLFCTKVEGRYLPTFLFSVTATLLWDYSVEFRCGKGVLTCQFKSSIPNYLKNVLNSKWPKHISAALHQTAPLAVWWKKCNKSRLIVPYRVKWVIGLFLCLWLETLGVWAFFFLCEIKSAKEVINYGYIRLIEYLLLP